MADFARENLGAAADRSEAFGERLLDRTHEMPPQLIAPLVAAEVRATGGRDVSILLQDYGQLMLVPLPGRGLAVEDPVPIDGSRAGEVFLRAVPAEHPHADGTRMSSFSRLQRRTSPNASATTGTCGATTCP